MFGIVCAWKGKQKNFPNMVISWELREEVRGSQKKDQAKTTTMGQNAPPEIAGKGDQDAERRSLETNGNPEKQKVSKNSASMLDTDSDLSNSLFQIQIQNT